MFTVESRIRQLQERRRQLLDRRCQRGVNRLSLDTELTIVRSELIALYEMLRQIREDESRLAG